MAITVNIKGLDKLFANLKSLGEEGNKMADAVVGSTVDRITLAQKNAAPVDLGKIKQNLGNRKIKPALYEVFSNAPESPYQEFGTGPQVQIPAQWADVAAQSQGKSTATWAEFIIALTEWVGRHGGGTGGGKNADKQAAWLIARAILRRGLKPQPFFYHNVDEGFNKLPELLKKAYAVLESKYKKL